MSAAAIKICATMAESDGEGITDNESNFESASYYLGRNLAREEDMAEIDAAAAGDDDVNEIPVWVRGETRWIAGVTEHTTAADLVEALLIDDRSLVDPATGTSNSTSGAEPSTAVLQQFVITERWRQMEQILEPKTKVWKIWKAWGEAQCEVRLRLRRIDRNGPSSASSPVTTTMPPTATTGNATSRRGGHHKHHHQVDKEDQEREEEEEDCGQVLYDSGRESPTGSAIVRRRRHRASKSTAAWLTQAQTVHPKSSKSTIEKLMSLILEQGETIQHQLSKLRDREIQISQLEEQRHRLREQEHGKNYLLETYLNGLHEAEEKDLTTINSDSGVNTEDTQSPNGGTSPAVLEGEDKIIPSISGAGTKKGNLPNMFEYTERETELLRDHENVKSLKLKLNSEAAALSSKKKATGTRQRRRESGNDNDDGVENEEWDDLEDKIEVLEKIYLINKDLQKEEELLVRLNAKIKRYESENPNLKEDEILDTLNRLNSEIEQRNREIEITNREIELSDELLHKKEAFLSELGAELGNELDEEAALMTTTGHGHDGDTHKPISCDVGFGNGQFMREGNYLDVNPENIYNISKILLKYSDDGITGPGTGAPDADRRDGRINIAACHQPPINKTDTNKRIIIGADGRAPQPPPLTEMGSSSSPASALPNNNRHTVTTRVQIHKQPQPVVVEPQPRTADFVDCPSHSAGNHYLGTAQQMRLLPNLQNENVRGGASPLTTPGPATSTNFTPVDLIAAAAPMTMMPPPPQLRRDFGHDDRRRVPGPPLVMGPLACGQMNISPGQLIKSSGSYNAPPVPGISDKVAAINAARNISATLMDNKKLAHKNFILTSKAYEGLSPVATGAPIFGDRAQHQQMQQQPQTDVTQLGTLV